MVLLINTSPILTESSSLEWSNINGVPSDLSDGDNDVLNTLNCVEGQVAIKGSSGWDSQEFTYLWIGMVMVRWPGKIVMIMIATWEISQQMQIVTTFLLLKTVTIMII